MIPKLCFFYQYCPRRIGTAFLSCAVLSFVLLMSSAQISAQVAFGINGTVVDTNGAAVPGATVTATDLATNVVSRATTSAAGAYVIILSNPGHYSVTVEAKGFKQYVQANVTVDAGKFSAVPTTLAPGAVTQTIQVSGGQSL